MEFSAQEKSYIWLDSFPLEESEKRKLLAVAVSPVALVKGLENFKDMFVDFKKQDVFQKRRIAFGVEHERRVGKTLPFARIIV